MQDLPTAWHGRAELQFRWSGEHTIHQGGAQSPLKLQRAFPRADGRCELPVLHTAGGLVGGDRLSLSADLGPGCRVLLTSVAAQKVYGSVGRLRRAPQGDWARQELEFQLAAEADLEWLPQELVVFAGGLFEQRARVDLAPSASWLGWCGADPPPPVRAWARDAGVPCWRSGAGILERGAGSWWTAWSWGRPPWRVPMAWQGNRCSVPWSGPRRSR
jgi:urease accessory protein